MTRSRWPRTPRTIRLCTSRARTVVAWLRESTDESRAACLVRQGILGKATRCCLELRWSRPGSDPLQRQDEPDRRRDRRRAAAGACFERDGWLVSDDSASLSRGTTRAMTTSRPVRCFRSSQRRLSIVVGRRRVRGDRRERCRTGPAERPRCLERGRRSCGSTTSSPASTSTGAQAEPFREPTKRLWKCRRATSGRGRCPVGCQGRSSPVCE